MQVAVYDYDSGYGGGSEFCYGWTNAPINGDGFSQCQQDDYVK